MILTLLMYRPALIADGETGTGAWQFLNPPGRRLALRLVRPALDKRLQLIQVAEAGLPGAMPGLHVDVADIRQNRHLGSPCTPHCISSLSSSGGVVGGPDQN